MSMDFDRRGGPVSAGLPADAGRGGGLPGIGAKRAGRLERRGQRPGGAAAAEEQAGRAGKAGGGTGQAQPRAGQRPRSPTSPSTTSGATSLLGRGKRGSRCGRPIRAFWTPGRSPRCRSGQGGRSRMKLYSKERALFKLYEMLSGEGDEEEGSLLEALREISDK